MSFTKYEAIAADLQARIQAGEFGLGERITSMTDLEERYGAAQHTVRRALEVLISQGVIQIVRGKGAFVRRIPEPSPRTDELLASLIDAHAALGRAIATLRRAV